MPLFACLLVKTQRESCANRLKGTSKQAMMAVLGRMVVERQSGSPLQLVFHSRVRWRKQKMHTQVVYGGTLRCTKGVEKRVEEKGVGTINELI